MSMAFAILLAAWLGIQTSISPCPLATNIAAISFLAKDLGSTRRVLASGALYVLGRTIAYVALAAVLVSLLARHLSGGSDLSRALQRYGPMATGPILVLVGMLLLGMLGWTGSLRLGGAGIQERARGGGIWWAGILGILFALSFCPVSAGLFFFTLVPMAARQGSPLLLPALFGVGTALPVIGFAFLMAFAGQYLGKAFGRLTQIERWVRTAAGVIFIAAGIYYCLRYIYGLSLP
ncbi:MAG TPA: aromatic aminobenezylarsenical efflux permease ArsG family transporter [Phycisphaerae bacterium]|nr:aromatic aminobenezylarsenical efflux permease ArsG family transporter [Phycisphaerae bacterium]